MPLYEYRCGACTGVFEVLVRSVGNEPTPICPICGATEVRKLLSLVAQPKRRGESGSVTTMDAAPNAWSGGGCCGGACGCGH
jgi:putative FmdB family regulatory protein